MGAGSYFGREILAKCLTPYSPISMVMWLATSGAPTVDAGQRSGQLAAWSTHTKFMYHGFIKSIPMALDESATIEGASKFQIYRHVILPMLKPITATIVILNSLWIWNDFLLPSLALFQKSLARHGRIFRGYRLK